METESTDLEQRLGIADNIKEPTPPRHLGLACATHHNVQCGVEMIQEFDYSWENPARGVCFNTFQVCLCLHDGMQEDFERVSKESQFFVVGSKYDSIFGVAGFEVV